jgi:Tfp pilus assembly protein PilF
MMDRAKVSLEQAISRFSNKARFELELARVLLKEGETGNQSAELRAEQLLHSAVGHDNKLPDAHYELGELALRRGEASAALMHLETAAKLDPSSAKTHFALSRAYRSLGRKEDGAREAVLFDKLKE